ncbi:MAG: SlyX family protein [Bacterioplanes sp.]|nr:SlyX family protein [Bacterioplanes sp.]
MSKQVLTNDSEARIIELETRMAFLEDTVDQLNEHVSNLSQQFSVAQHALQMMHQKLQHLDPSQSLLKDLSDETPPPHY